MDYRGVLHRDGSVLMSVSLDQLKVTMNIRFPILFDHCHFVLDIVFLSSSVLQAH